MCNRLKGGFPDFAGPGNKFRPDDINTERCLHHTVTGDYLNIKKALMAIGADWYRKERLVDNIEVFVEKR